MIIPPWAWMVTRAGSRNSSDLPRITDLVSGDPAMVHPRWGTAAPEIYFGSLSGPPHFKSALTLLHSNTPRAWKDAVLAFTGQRTAELFFNNKDRLAHK